MDHPLDLRNGPFTVEDMSADPRLSRWFSFGSAADRSTTVSDCEDVLFIGVPSDIAVEMITARDKFTARIRELLNVPSDAKEFVMAMEPTCRAMFWPSSPTMPEAKPGWQIVRTTPTGMDPISDIFPTEGEAWGSARGRIRGALVNA